MGAGCREDKKPGHMDKTGLAKLVADLVEHVELASRVTEWLWSAHVLSLEAPDALEAKIGTFPVYLRAVDGSDIALTLRAARLCGTLEDWITESGGDGSFPVPYSPNVVHIVASLCETPDMPFQGSIDDALTIIHVAYDLLDAPSAASAAAKSIAAELSCKSAGELRAVLDVSAASYEEANLTDEHLLTPPDDGSASGKKVPRVSGSLSSRLNAEGAPHILQYLLCHFDAHTLHTLKAVDAAWCERARETLCHDDWRQKQPYDVAWAADKGLLTTANVNRNKMLRSAGDIKKLFEVLVASPHIEVLRCGTSFYFQVNTSPMIPSAQWHLPMFLTIPPSGCALPVVFTHPPLFTAWPITLSAKTETWRG